MLPLPVAGSLDDRKRTRPEFSSLEKLSALLYCDSPPTVRPDDACGENLCEEAK